MQHLLMNHLHKLPKKKKLLKRRDNLWKKLKMNNQLKKLKKLKKKL
jgi:hypothetical protein